MYQVQIGDENKAYQEGTTYETIVRESHVNNPDNVMLVKMNGILQELNKPLSCDCTLEPVRISDEPGYLSYRRSACFLLLKAVYSLYSREEIGKLRIEFSAGDAYYCELEGTIQPNEEFVKKVSDKMKNYVNNKIPILKKNIHTWEAIKCFEAYGMMDKASLFKYRRASKVNLYSINNFEDYYYGYMVPNTSYLKWFALYPYEDGFLLQFPKRREPVVMEKPHFSKKVLDVMKTSEKWSRDLEVPTLGALNDAISRGEMEDLILVQEAIQEKTIGDIAGTIAEDESKKLIMIAGPSSSGKTTFSHRLAIQLRAHGLKPHPIAVDNYFKDRIETPKDADGNYNFECLEAIDIKLFNEQMDALLSGEEVELPEFNFITGYKEYKGNRLKLAPDEVLVLEGIHCLNDKLSYKLPKENKFKIYISALTQLNLDEHNRIPTTDGRLIRRMVRDARTRGASASRTIGMWASVRKGEEENIFPYQEDADAMFNSALIYELSVLKQYAEPILFNISPEEPEYMEAKRLLKFLDYFLGVDSNHVPFNSLLREFIGGSCFRV